MPFHDYSSALLRTKSKDQQLRHSSPAAYGRANEAKGKGQKNNNNELEPIDLLRQEDLPKSDKATKKEKLKSHKRIPFRSNSNPTYFEDWSKSPETSRKKKSPLFYRRQSSGSSSVNSTASKSSPLLKHSITANSCTSIPSTTPSIVIDKPPVPSSNGSPLTGVKLRSKPSSSPKGGRRRQGFVLDANTTISSPVLISHEILPGDSKIKLRDIEQQGEVLTNLQTPSVDDKQKTDKAQVEATAGVGSRMAERIQRTIRALYTSNSSPKKSYSPIRDHLVAEDSDFSDGSSYSPELRGKALAGPQYGHLNEGSPKADKRNARKRSPKPSHKNNLQVKDVDGSRRFKWRGSVNKIVKKFGTGQPFVLNSTFGVHLEDCPPSPTNEFVPCIVEICCRIVEERGLDFTGIYRVPGNSAALNALQDDLNNHGVDSIRLDDERFKDLNVMSSLLKSFFRKLPEPLFTNELYHSFIKGNRQPTAQDRLNRLRELVHMLPGPHYETLKFLITHLRLVADHCEANKMEVRNLAIVFGPTLVRNTAADNTATMVTDMSDQCRIIESIIDHSEWFFSDNMDDVPNLSNVALPPEREHEAVPSIEFLLENVGRKPGDAGTSDSAKSKGSDDSENSFSRDLMEIIFGKKWKQGGNPQTAAEEDDGGFGEYHSRKVEESPKRKQQYEKPSSIINTSTDSPRISEGLGSPSQQAVIPNVSERLMDFYREQVERLSQTAIGQTLPAFSSADSSPRTTPRHSTVFNSPLVFPPQGDSRSRVNSDSQDPRHNIAASYEIQPNAYTVAAVPFPSGHAAHQIMTDSSHSLSVPYYKYPPNPYQYSQQLYQPNQYQKYPPNFYAYSNEPNSSNTPKMAPKVQVKSHSHEDGINNIPKPKPRKHSTGSYRTDEYVKRSPQVEPNVALREIAMDVSMNENSPPILQNERLVGELPHVATVTTKGPSVSRKSSQSGNISQPAGKVKGHYKKSSITSFDSLVNQPQHKRIKTPLTENFSVTQAPTTATSERLFSRYDPKRRGIRFGGTENDASVGAAPKKTQLTATERLFNGQQQQQQQQQELRRRPSAREHRRQRVTRRHTLSGLQDLQQHSPTFRFKSDMRRGTAGQNLSLHDLTSTAGNMQQSAMERLNPKGANLGMTLKNWIVQERLRNKTTVKKSDSVNRASMRRKDEKGNRGVSYV